MTVRWRRLVRDYERLPETYEAMGRWAMIGLMLNRLAPCPGPKPVGSAAWVDALPDTFKATATEETSWLDGILSSTGASLRWASGREWVQVATHCLPERPTG